MRWLSAPGLEATRGNGRETARSAREESPIVSETVRERLLREVRDHPGLSLSELMTRLGIGWGTLHHHATALEAQRLVRIETAGRRRLVFPAGQSPMVAAEARGLVYGGPARRIALALRDRPGQSILELCERTGNSPRAVYYHVKRLLEGGLLRSSSSTRHSDLEPTPLLLELVVDAPRET